MKNSSLLISFSDYLLKIVPKLIKKIYILKSEVIVYVYYKHIFQLIFFLKNHTYTRYNSLSDLCAVDFPNRLWRFEVVYNLLSIDFNSRIRIKAKVDELCSISSIVSILPGSNWYEREIWDLFGIFFFNHPDLRRILTDYGFDGFPLRKDFPLTGYIEIRYSDSQKRIITEPVQLSQEYRFFDFSSTWLHKQSTQYHFFNNASKN